MQASPCGQDLRRLTLHPFALSRVTDMLWSPLPFDARLVSYPKRSIALNLLLLWSYLTYAEAAHMIGEWLIQIIPHIPSHAQSIRDLAHEQALRAVG